jgi:DNA-binding NtrC family response regulator
MVSSSWDGGALKVLVVDDQPAVRTALEVLFDLSGLRAVFAATPEEALAMIASEEIGVVVQDMNFRRGATTGEEGTALVRAIKRLDPDLPILIMTAFTSLESAVGLIKEGASDYIAKPWDDEKLVRAVKNLLRIRSLEQDNVRLRAPILRAREELARQYDLAGLVYVSAQMHEVVSLAVRIARADVPVFISGPNGAGKERIAEVVRKNSSRSRGPFVKVNAGGLPDDLLEAELFGAEAGAFTGAKKLRIGRFEEASGGTLFLDEIGNLSPSGQMKLLRVLQTGEFQRLGSNQTRRTDVRIVSATNADLPRAIARGTFREDLYFRLNVIELAVPALRDRPDDIEPLARHLLNGRLADPGDTAPRLTAEGREALFAHDWPGNVRELENRLQRAVLVCHGGAITARDLGLDDAAYAGARAESASASSSMDDASIAERAAIERALVESQGVVAKAAAKLGVSRQALYRRMDRLGLTLERRLR